MNVSHKENANAALANGDYSLAINFYSIAIREDASSSILYSSRAKAYYYHLLDQPKTTIQQWKKVAEDCEKAISLDKRNYDGMYYNGLYTLYGLENYSKALELIEEAYKKSLEHAKNSKKYSLPKEIYLQILKLKKKKKEDEEEDRLINSNPLFSKLVLLLQKDYHRELDELNSKELSKAALDYAITKLSLKYAADTKDLVKVFSNNYNHASMRSSKEAPDYLCDPISFSLFHDPVVTPSGNSYEKVWLFHHLSLHDYDPLTRQKLSEDQCYPNISLKMCVDDYLQEHATDLSL